MKVLFLILALATALPVMAKECRYERDQSRELRIKSIDNGYRLDLHYNGRWRPMLTTSEEIAMPRFGLTRAEVAFLLKIDGTWTLQLLGLNGESMQLGELSEKPDKMCYDRTEQNFHLVNAAGALTALPLD